MKTITQFIIALACLAMPVTNAGAAEQANDFVITDRATGKPIRRDDFKGQIVLLDFFAYWCPPCQASSPVVEKEIAQYYKKKGGNVHGIEVKVISVNVESDSPASTNEFIKKAGLETVANDFDASGAWTQFSQADGGGIPHFVIFNGTEGGTFRQWEVLHSAAGFRGSEFYRNIIDSIKGKPGTPGATGKPEISISQPIATELIDGQATKSFGTIALNKPSKAMTFTVKNMGKTNLTGLAILKSGAAKKNFIISKMSKNSLKPGVSATFKVTFKPTVMGERRAKIRVISNDADENPFDINLTGLGSK